MRKFIFGITLIAFFVSNAQDETRILTLDECIEMAVNRNLTVKQNQNNLFASKSNKTQALFNFAPNLSGNYDYTFVRGSVINNAGQVIGNDSDQSSPNISSNLILFNAFANHHLLNRRKHEFEASYYQLENSKIDIRATVIRNYLNVLVNKENLKISDQRLEFLENQLDREQKRVSVGVGNLDAVYNFQSQVANERLNNVTLNNLLQSSQLALLQSIQIENYDGVEVAPLNIDDIEILVDYDTYDVVLADIMNYSFSIKSAEETQSAAKAQLGQTRSFRYPTVSVFGQYSRFYSKRFDGGEYPSYFDQINNNNRSIVQASINIPIFSRYQNQNAIDNAKVGFNNSQLQHQQAVLDVTNAAQRDYLDLKAAQTSYQTSVDNYEALNQTFEFIKKRYETGNTDFYSYLESLNNKNRAEAQLISAKYTIILRKRILDLYRGL